MDASGSQYRRFGNWLLLDSPLTLLLVVLFFGTFDQFPSLNEVHHGS